LGEMDVVSTMGRKQPSLGNYYSLDSDVVYKHYIP
jgi:hypothetical protein